MIWSASYDQQGFIILVIVLVLPYLKIPTNASRHFFGQ